MYVVMTPRTAVVSLACAGVHLYDEAGYSAVYLALDSAEAAHAIAKAINSFAPEKEADSSDV